MTYQEAEEEAEAIGFIIDEIIRKAEGSEIVRVTYNYPKGWAAVEYGACFGFGLFLAVIAAALCVNLSSIVWGAVL